MATTSVRHRSPPDRHHPSDQVVMGKIVIRALPRSEGQYVQEGVSGPEYPFDPHHDVVPSAYSLDMKLKPASSGAPAAIAIVRHPGTAAAELPLSRERRVEEDNPWTTGRALIQSVSPLPTPRAERPIKSRGGGRGFPECSGALGGSPATRAA